jgi:hypothetical protein
MSKPMAKPGAWCRILQPCIEAQRFFLIPRGQRPSTRKRVPSSGIAAYTRLSRITSVSIFNGQTPKATLAIRRRILLSRSIDVRCRC